MLQRAFQLFYALFFLLVTNSQAEQVKFMFIGEMRVPGTGTTTLFNIAVPRNSAITGTFSYEVPSIPSSSNPATFHQMIAGGFTLDVNGGTIRLSAAEYMVLCADDFQRQNPPGAVDVLQVQYDSRNSPAPAPLLVNGIPWVGTAYMTLDLSWPSATFSDPNLTVDLPLMPGLSVDANSSVGSSASPKLFSISSVTNIPEPPGLVLSTFGLLGLSIYVVRSKF